MYARILRVFPLCANVLRVLKSVMQRRPSRWQAAKLFLARWESWYMYKYYYSYCYGWFLCNLITESTVNPVPMVFSDCFLIMMSLSIKSSGILLEINAIITWLYFPISFVKQRAGQTLDAEKSSKGNGTSTMVFLIIKWLSVF